VIVYSVDYCAPPPLVDNAVARLNQTSRSVVITCMIGHRFPDGLTSHTYYCRADGNWDYDIPRCDGISAYSYLYAKYVAYRFSRLFVFCVNDYWKSWFAILWCVARLGDLF